MGEAKGGNRKWRGVMAPSPPFGAAPAGDNVYGRKMF